MNQTASNVDISPEGLSEEIATLKLLLLSFLLLLLPMLLCELSSFQIVGRATNKFIYCSKCLMAGIQQITCSEVSSNVDSLEAAQTIFKVQCNKQVESSESRRGSNILR